MLLMDEATLSKHLCPNDINNNV